MDDKTLEFYKHVAITPSQYDSTCREAAKLILEQCEDLRRARELAETAWGIIANASHGDWSQETTEWRAAAERWRDAYHAFLRETADEGKAEHEPSAKEAAHD